MSSIRRMVPSMIALAALPHALSAGEGCLTVYVSAGDYAIEWTGDGCGIDMDGFETLAVPGNPALPVKRFLFLLPPGTRATSASLAGSSESVLEGDYRIAASAGIIPAGGCLSHGEFLDRLVAEQQENCAETYFGVEEYPQRTVWLSGAGTLGKYCYAMVSFAPFSWEPGTGRLNLVREARVAITYASIDPGNREEALLARIMEDTSRDRRAEELFENYHQLSGLYHRAESADEGTDETWDYVVITSGALVGAVTGSGFVDWKTELGHEVRIVLVSDPEITGQPGDDLAAQIRNFLRSRYAEWGIEYVLLVGDYAGVPMRICYPDSSNHVYNPSNPGLVAAGTPTDCYYSDLSYPDSLSWDLDGDGFYGEFNQDMPDFMPEISVGRVPVGIPDRIHYALSKSVAFEQDNGAWKSNILHAGTILFFENQNFSGYPFVDGATLLDSMETGLMAGWSITHMSEQAGIVTSPFPWPPVTEAAFTGTWGGGQFSVVNWSGHGWPNGVSRSVWMWDDGDGVPESGNGELQGLPLINIDSGNLDDDHPSVVFAVSCDVGFPEPNPYGNLGIDMFTRPGWGPSVGMLSASRPAAVSGDWKESPGGTEQICFDFNRYLIAEGARTGEALAWGRYDAHAVYGWELVYEYMNLYNINLYGDPSLLVEGYPAGIEGQGSVGDTQILFLQPGRPNPFSSECSMVFTLNTPGHVEMSVYDIGGRRVTTLVDQYMGSGVHSASWQADAVPEGVYLVRLTSSGEETTVRIVLAR